MQVMNEAVERLAYAIARLADALDRYCALNEPQEKTPRSAVVSRATYDRKQSQAEKELQERFSQSLPDRGPGL